MTEDEWFQLIRYDRSTYGLPAHPWITARQAARYWVTWEAAEKAQEPSPALCRRCGTALRYTDYPHQQLHVWCAPPGWSEHLDRRD